MKLCFWKLTYVAKNYEAHILLLLGQVEKDSVIVLILFFPMHCMRKSRPLFVKECIDELTLLCCL
jgi:hypothetical protein